MSLKSESLEESYKNTRLFNLYLILKFYAKYFEETNLKKKEAFKKLIKRLQFGE